MSRHFAVAVVFFLLVQPGAAEFLPEGADGGFEYSIFDGKSLDGFVVENDCKASVKDGQLLLEGGDGWLRSHHTYRDFALHVEWKALKKTRYDAGIYIRTPIGGKPYPKQGYQSNMLQGKEGNIGRLKGASSTGLIKEGDWNTFDFTVVGESVELKINGKPAYKVGGLKIAEGYVGIQIEVPGGGQFLVRQFRIRELGFRSLFNGKDLTAWKGAGKAADTCWTVKEGAITCTGAKGPWLRSTEEFGDFNFRFEYQVAPGGNSGIYVRVPENGLHHRANDKEAPAGFEVQVLDDSAEKYAKLKAYQYCGSVYDILGASKRVGRPPGQWNTMEIDCRGQEITTIHNGIEIVHVTPEKYPLIKLRKLKGYLGLQNHSSIVKFRNLRIGKSARE